MANSPPALSARVRGTAGLSLNHRAIFELPRDEQKERPQVCGRSILHAPSSGGASLKSSVIRLRGRFLPIPMTYMVDSCEANREADAGNREEHPRFRITSMISGREANRRGCKNGRKCEEQVEEPINRRDGVLRRQWPLGRCRSPHVHRGRQGNARLGGLRCAVPSVTALAPRVRALDMAGIPRHLRSCGIQRPYGSSRLLSGRNWGSRPRTGLG